MQLTRTRKEEIVEEISGSIDSYPVIGILDMHSLPARQLQEIKKELVGEADIRMSRKTLLDLALDSSGKENVADLKDSGAVQPALIFSDQNPFRLYRIIQDKKSSAPASGGEIAPSDIEIREGNTGIDPGPMLGRIQELGAETSVEDGKIKITKGAVAVESGEVITREVAEVLNALGMEPLEVGLDLKLVYEDGDIYGRDVLHVDIDEYREDVESGVSGAFNLAVNAGIMTEETAPVVIGKAFNEARNLAINAGILEKDVIEDIISRAASDARSLDISLDLEDIEEGESDDGEDEDNDDETDEDTEEEVN